MRQLKRNVRFLYFMYVKWFFPFFLSEGPEKFSDVLCSVVSFAGVGFAIAASVLFGSVGRSVGSGCFQKFPSYAARSAMSMLASFFLHQLRYKYVSLLMRRLLVASGNQDHEDGARLCRRCRRSRG